MNLTSHVEREYKFLTIEPDTFHKLIETKKLAGFIAEDSQDHVIKDIYFDSEDLDLYFHRAGLRLRNEGKQFLITFKKHIRIKNGCLERSEMEQLLHSFHYENTLIEMKDTQPYQTALIDTFQKNLEPIIEIITQRKKTKFVKEESEIEISLDRTQFLKNNPFKVDFEIEVEFKKGSEKAFYEVAKELFTDFSLIQSRSSKYKRGLEANSII